MTGGCCNIENFQKRMYAEMRKLRPVGSAFNLYVASDPMLDSWKGARMWSLNKSAISRFLTKNEYDEYGPGYLKHHALGNQYVSSPE